MVAVKKGEPVKIGFAAALSGAGLDVLGIDEQRGAELAVADKEDILGFGIELVAEDDLCSAEGGTTVANKFVADPSIVGRHRQHVLQRLAGGHGHLPAVPLHDGLALVTGVVLTTRGNTSFNRVCWNDKIQGPAAAKFLRTVLRVERVATIHDGSPYGEGLVGAMADAFKALGGTVVAQEAVNVGDTDMRPLLERSRPPTRKPSTSAASWLRAPTSPASAPTSA